MRKRISVVIICITSETAIIASLTPFRVVLTPAGEAHIPIFPYPIIPHISSFFCNIRSSEKKADVENLAKQPKMRRHLSTLGAKLEQGHRILSLVVHIIRPAVALRDILLLFFSGFARKWGDPQ